MKGELSACFEGLWGRLKKDVEGKNFKGVPHISTLKRDEDMHFSNRSFSKLVSGKFG